MWGQILDGLAFKIGTIATQDRLVDNVGPTILFSLLSKPDIAPGQVFPFGPDVGASFVMRPGAEVGCQFFYIAQKGSLATSIHGMSFYKQPNRGTV